MDAKVAGVTSKKNRPPAKGVGTNMTWKVWNDNFCQGMMLILGDVAMQKGVARERM